MFIHSVSKQSPSDREVFGAAVLLQVCTNRLIGHGLVKESLDIDASALQPTPSPGPVGLAHVVVGQKAVDVAGLTVKCPRSCSRRLK